MSRLYRRASPVKILEELVKTGGLERAKLRGAIGGTDFTFRAAIKCLKDDGLIVEQVTITKKGRQKLTKVQAGKQGPRVQRVRKLDFSMCSPFVHADKIRQELDAAAEMAREALDQRGLTARK